MLEKFGDRQAGRRVRRGRQVVLADKDAFLNACQAHHDFHVNVIDALEDKLSTGEKRSLDKLMGSFGRGSGARNRERRDGDPRAGEAADTQASSR